MDSVERSKICIESYLRLGNLKLVEEETSIKWQSVYWYLKKAKIPVIGNKAIYGSSKDKFACVGEKFFNEVIPYATNQNLILFQPKIDFIVKGYGVEIKSAKFTCTHKNKRWAFSLKKQKKLADFFVLIAFNDMGNEVLHYFLMPNELLRKELQTISIPQDINQTKWKDFLISEKELREFFDMIEPK